MFIKFKTLKLNSPHLTSQVMTGAPLDYLEREEAGESFGLFELLINLSKYAEGRT